MVKNESDEQMCVDTLYGHRCIILNGYMAIPLCLVSILCEFHWQISKALPKTIYSLVFLHEYDYGDGVVVNGNEFDSQSM